MVRPRDSSDHPGNLHHWWDPDIAPDNRYKPIHYGRGGPFAEPPWRWELYDLIDDPSESTDLAAVHPEIVQPMAGQLAEWNESVRACLERLKP